MILDPSSATGRQTICRTGWASSDERLGGMPLVATWLTARERQHVQAVAEGSFRITQHEDLAALRHALAREEVDGMIVSAARLGATSSLRALTALIRGFPGVLAAGLVLDIDEAQVLGGALLLGHAGVRVVIDGRVSTGWCALRRALQPASCPDALSRRGLSAVREALASQPSHGGVAREHALSPELTRLFEIFFSRDVRTANDVATRVGVHPSTLNSRFFRAGLPSPRRCLAYARLVRAARMGEAPGLSIADIAHRLGASSPQSFGRTVQTLSGLRPRDFRYRYDGERMLGRFCAELITPHVSRWQTFRPLGEEPGVRESASEAGRPISVSEPVRSYYAGRAA